MSFVVTKDVVISIIIFVWWYRTLTIWPNFSSRKPKPESTYKTFTTCIQSITLCLAVSPKMASVTGTVCIHTSLHHCNFFTPAAILALLFSVSVWLSSSLSVRFRLIRNSNHL
ncbi:hypothetical protein L6452_29672 [Arctium lappa]|uniref:Uncharacterized protein n=1 Tax=Arctium lappa TaxID=4217 RepID=A0ACB8ZI42_ARCLA|nr:hypothetical protein L6452_29672 [Arctium lappa]